MLNFNSWQDNLLETEAAFWYYGERFRGTKLWDKEAGNWVDSLDRFWDSTGISGVKE